MQTINKLLNDSFNHANDLHNDDFVTCVDKLDKVTEHCSINKMPVFFNIDIYNEEIISGMNLADWLYNTLDNSDNEIEKSTIREILDQRCTTDSIGLIGNFDVFDICFYCINKSKSSYVHGIEEWIALRQSLLSKVTDKIDFERELIVCFPKLVFSDEIHTGLNSLNSFSTWVNHIVSHLAILNDIGQTSYNTYGESEAIKIISSKLPSGAECTGQNSSDREKLKFNIKLSKEKTISVDCYPHTKLISAYSDGRIYFRFKHDEIANGKKLIVGWIGSHRDD